MIEFGGAGEDAVRSGGWRCGLVAQGKLRLGSRCGRYAQGGEHGGILLRYGGGGGGRGGVPGEVRGEEAQGVQPGGAASGVQHDSEVWREFKCVGHGLLISGCFRLSEGNVTLF